MPKDSNPWTGHVPPDTLLYSRSLATGRLAASASLSIHKGRVTKSYPGRIQNLEAPVKQDPGRSSLSRVALLFLIARDSVRPPRPSRPLYKQPADVAKQQHGPRW